MSWRTVVHLVGLPLAVLCYSVGHYNFRSGLFLVLIQDLDMGGADVAWVMWAAMLLHLVGFAAAAVLGLLVRPYAALVLGALGSVVSIASFPGLDATSAGISVLGEGFCAGMITVALWSLAVVQLEARYRYGRLAFLTSMFVALDLGAAVGMASSAGSFGLGPWPHVPLLLLALALAGVGWPQCWAEPGLAESGPKLVVAGAVGSLTFPAVALGAIAGSAGFAGLTATGTAPASSLFSIGPVVAVLAGFVSGACWLVAQWFGVRVHDVSVVGLAIVGYAISTLAAHSAAVATLGLTSVVGVFVANGLTDVWVMPLVLARVAADQHWRAVPLLVGGWMALRLLGSALIEPMTQFLPLDLLLLGTVFVTAIAGLVLALGGFSAREHLLPTEPDGVG